MKDTKTLKKQIIAFLIITEFAGCAILYGHLGDANSTIQSLTSQISEITQQNSELKSEKSVLEEKVNILSYTVNMKVQQEQEREEEVRQSYIPTGLPFKGTASYNGQEKSLDGKPIAVFNNDTGINVVASANGTVASIEGDAQQGFVVTIDHGNGYCSIYRNSMRPLVNEGDAVTDKTALYPVTAQNREFGYQITENGEYIDPIELIESYG